MRGIGNKVSGYDVYNMMAEIRTGVFVHTQKKEIYEITDMLTQWWESSHNVYIYQIIRLYTLNIIFIGQIYLF